MGRPTPSLSQDCRIAVLMACHNRREKTLACLRALSSSHLPDGVQIHVVLLDDGSSDGTAEAVMREFPATEILYGDGSLFWNRGMHRAFGVALAEGYDAYLWLNDDTILEGGALDVLMNTAATVGPKVIVVGATRDARTGEHTYGGGRRVSPGIRPFFYQQVVPSGEPKLVDVMNGNVVLIMGAAARELGNIDPIFEHGMGDIDYSLRAARSRVPVLLAPTYVGTCSRNPVSGTYQDRLLGIRGRLRQAFSRKGLPPRSWLRMCQRHGGFIWPAHFFWGYVRIMLGRG